VGAGEGADGENAPARAALQGARTCSAPAPSRRSTASPSRTPAYRIFYSVAGWWLLPLARLLAPNAITTTEAIGRAMIAVTEKGFPKKHLDPADINAAARPGLTWASAPLWTMAATPRAHQLAAAGLGEAARRRREHPVRPDTHRLEHRLTHRLHQRAPGRHLLEGGLEDDHHRLGAGLRVRQARAPPRSRRARRAPSRPPASRS